MKSSFKETNCPTVINIKAGVDQHVTDTLQLLIKDIDDSTPVFVNAETINIKENGK